MESVHLLEGFSLFERAGIAVEQIAVLGFVHAVSEVVQNHAVNDIIRYKVTGIDAAFGFLAQIGSFGNVFAERDRR